MNDRGRETGLADTVAGTNGSTSIVMDGIERRGLPRVEIENHGMAEKTDNESRNLNLNLPVTSADQAIAEMERARQ